MFVCFFFFFFFCWKRRVFLFIQSGLGWTGLEVIWVSAWSPWMRPLYRCISYQYLLKRRKQLFSLNSLIVTYFHSRLLHQGQQCRHWKIIGINYEEIVWFLMASHVTFHLTFQVTFHANPRSSKIIVQSTRVLFFLTYWDVSVTESVSIMKRFFYVHANESKNKRNLYLQRKFFSR